jgi:hypothetical protein
MVKAQEKWLDAHSDILIDAIAQCIGSKVKVQVQHKLRQFAFTAHKASSSG